MNDELTRIEMRMLERDEHPLWEDVLHGRVEPAEAERLLLAQGDDRAEVARAKILFSPISSARRSEIIDALLDRHGPDSTVVDMAAASSERDGSRGQRTEDARGLDGRRWALAAVFGLAAALLLAWLLVIGPQAGVGGAPEIAALDAEYEVELLGGLRDTRGSTSVDTERFSVDGSMRIVVAPRSRVEHPIGLVLLAVRGAEVRHLEVEPQIGEEGAMAVEGSVQDVLGLPSGRWTLVVVVGRPEALAVEPSALLRAEPLPGTERMRVEIEIVAVALAVDLWGCEVRKGHRCVISGATELRAWVHHPEASSAELSGDGRRIDATLYETPGQIGQGVAFTVPAGVRTLEVSLPNSSGSGAWAVSLDDAYEITTPEQAAVVRENERLHRQANDAQQGGRWADAAEILERVMRSALGAGLLSRGLDAGVAAAFIRSRYLSDGRGARALLGELGAVAERYPLGAAKVAYYRGVVEMTDGRVDKAATAYEAAVHAALRLDDRQLARSALPMLALVSIDLGRYRRAAQWSIRALELSEGYPCDRAANSMNAGWAGVLLEFVEEPGALERGEPMELLTESWSIYSEGGECPDPRYAEAVRVSLALASAERGQWEMVARWLDGLDESRLTDLERHWLADVELRRQLASGGETIVALERLEASSRNLVDPSARWRAALRRGQVMEARGDSIEAIAAYRAAEEVLDRIAVLTALGMGRGLFVAQRAESAERLVSVLLDQGRADEAQCAARLSRLRSLPRGWGLRQVLDPAQRLRLDQLRTRYSSLIAADAEASTDLRSRARREAEATERRRDLDALLRELASLMDEAGGESPMGNCAELRPPSAGELRLVLFPVDDELAVLASYDDHVLGYTAPMPRGGGLDPRVLEPIAAQLAVARKLEVIAAHEAATVDLHASSWDGAPLIATLPVVYSADLPPVPLAFTTDWSAVLIEDPSGTLADAVHEEIIAIRDALVEQGWIAHVMTAAELHPDAIDRMLAGTRLLHYAGHATVEEAEDGTGDVVALGHEWTSRLDFGNGRAFDVGQILLLEEPPRDVVLLGCSTGVIDHRSPSGGMSLALAFLLSGSESVIAARAPIDNESASTIGRRLYGEGLPRGAFDPALALQRAQLAVRHTVDEDEWKKLRVWVR